MLNGEKIIKAGGIQKEIHGLQVGEKLILSDIILDKMDIWKLVGYKRIMANGII